MKVLIYKYLEDLAPVGGPNGYCFNILNELKKRNNDSIVFLDNKPKDKYKSNSLKKYFQTFFSLFKKKNSNVNFNEYDVIHFHSTKELYKNRKQLSKYKGKVLLTMHSPIPYHMEMVENIKNHHRFLGAFLRKRSFSKIDTYSFNRADIILLPCKEAEESFYAHWKKYKSIHDSNASKYKYIPTGIVPAKTKIPADEYRKSLGYSKEDFIVAYVGRHNQVKGYDRIIEVCKVLNDEKIKFLVGGKEFPIKAPDFKNWKEIGWTNDPYSLINCANTFILPNRETYFDIALLEALSLGKTCIISETGGNKVVIRNSNGGVYGFKDEKECAGIIRKLFESHIGYEPDKNVKKLFEENYSIERFVDSYLELLSSICPKETANG